MDRRESLFLLRRTSVREEGSLEAEHRSPGLEPG